MGMRPRMVLGRGVGRCTFDEDCLGLVGVWGGGSGERRRKRKMRGLNVRSHCENVVVVERRCRHSVSLKSAVLDQDLQVDSQSARSVRELSLHE